jgi:hypothetical protein
MSNRAPPDELADVRERIKALKRRDDVLRAAIISSERGLVGEEYEAVVTRSKSEAIDATVIKKEPGLAFLRPFLATIELKPRGASDGKI